MGATDFETVACGEDATDAFSRAVEDAQYRHGHEGYTGTIAEKDGFFMVGFGKGGPADAFKAVDYIQTASMAESEDADLVDYGQDLDALERGIPKKYRDWARLHADSRVEDKWAPAACYEVTNKRQAARLKAAHGLKGKRGIRVFIFFGVASC